MTHRSYGQFCAAAKALDVLGERWTLLVVRELLLGPRRFTDLLAALPGLSPSLLTSRLKQLAAYGVIRREQLPPPAGSWVYRITEVGLGAALVVKALADWGVQLLDVPDQGETVRADWLALHMAVSTPTGVVSGVHETYQIHCDDEVLHLVLTGIGVQASTGPAPGVPDLIIWTDHAAFVELSLGRTNLMDLVAAHRARVSGDAAVAARAAQLFSATHHPRSSASGR